MRVTLRAFPRFTIYLIHAIVNLGYCVLAGVLGMNKRIIIAAYHYIWSLKNNDGMFANLYDRIRVVTGDMGNTMRVEQLPKSTCMSLLVL